MDAPRTAKTARPTWRMQLGADAERAAAAHLERHGLTIVARNFRRRLGEIDLVAMEGDVLVIAEVRMRSDDRFGGAAASVDGWKRRRIVRAAQQFLQQHPEFARHRVRFDVLLVRPGDATSDIEWLRGAFEA